MADVEYLISLRDKMSGPLRGIQANTDKLDASLKKTSQSTSKYANKTREAKNQTNGLSDSFSGLRSVLMASAGFFAAVNLSNASREFEVMNARISATSGSAAEAVSNLSFIKDVSKELKLDIRGVGEGYGTLAASMSQAGSEAKEIQQVFKGFAVASRAMKVSTEKQKLIFLALGQMASKGTVSMEELKQQLGDSLPGAMGIAAKSMNLPLAKFMKMVEEGKILASDLLPKMSKELTNLYSGKALKSLNTFDASVQNLNTSWFLFRAEIGQALNNGIKPMIDGMSAILPMLAKFRGLIVGGGVAVGIITIVSALKKLRMVMFSVSAAGGPITLAISALAGLAIAIATHKTKIESLKEKYSDLTKEIFGTIDATGKLKDKMKEPLDVLTDQLGELTGLYKELQKMSKKEVFQFVSKDESLKKMLGQKAKDRYGNEKIDLFQEDVSMDRIFRVFRNVSAARKKIKDKEKALQPKDDLGDKFSGINVTSAAPKIFNINIDKLVEKFTVETTNIRDAPEKIREMVTMALQDALTQVKVQ